MIKNFKIIGVGGIGTILSELVARFLNYTVDDLQIITLVDGDTFEPSNRTRQVFDSIGKKADVKVEELEEKFPGLSFMSFPHFITSENIDKVIEEGDLVFSCLDNHKTRKLISDKCITLQNITLISGGNELTDGNVQVYMRRGGVNITNPITHSHPEIQNPEDKSPHELSCEQLANTSTPQIIFTNFTAAAIMGNVFYNIYYDEFKPVDEIYFDIKTFNHLAKKR